MMVVQVAFNPYPTVMKSGLTYPCLYQINALQQKLFREFIVINEVDQWLWKLDAMLGFQHQPI
jgi:hypothetical protein